MTNMVRRYMPEASGKHAGDVPSHALEEGSHVWRAELDLLHEYGVLPHVVVVFGDMIWGRAWAAFGERVQPRGWIVSYSPCEESSELFHHLNSVVVPEGGRERQLLLMKLGHPAARGDRKRAA